MKNKRQLIKIRKENVAELLGTIDNNFKYKKKNLLKYCINCVLDYDLQLNIKPIKDIFKNQRSDFYDLENDNIKFSRMLQLKYPNAKLTEIFNAVVVATINARKSGLIDTYPELIADNTTTKRNLYTWFEKNYITAHGRRLLKSALNCTAEQVERILNDFKNQLLQHP